MTATLTRTNACGHDGDGYLWIDESNAAITNSARPLCRPCYELRHGTPREFLRPLESDLYRSNAGILGVHNLLSSGDFANRVFSRGLFHVERTETGSRIIHSASGGLA
jgi:hypothetical protein